MSDSKAIHKFEANSGITVSTSTLAKIFGVTSRTIQNLTTDGVFEKQGRGNYLLTKSVTAYITYLKSKTGATQDAKSLENEKMQEEMMLKRAKREKAEMELKLYKGELHNADEVEKLYTGIILNAKAKLDSIPSKLAPKLINIQDVNQIFEIIQNEILKVEDELAEYDVTAFLDEEVIKHACD